MGKTPRLTDIHVSRSLESLLKYFRIVVCLFCFKVAVSCILAVASAGIVSPVAYTSWVSPQHLPVMGPNGVPLDTPAVNTAKAQHFHHVAEAKARNGDYHHMMYAAAPIAPLVASAPVVAAVATPVYQGPIHIPVMGPNGVPLDTPEVNAAKINHFHDVAEAKVRNGDHLIHHIAQVSAVAPIVATPVLAAPVHHHLPVMGPNGVPLDTPAVTAAKAQHFHAVAEAKVRNHGHWIAKRSLHLPVMGPNGVPLDTPAVNAAKAQHFHAVAEAKVRNGDHLMYAAPFATSYAAATPVISSGIAVSALATPVYQGPIHLPVIGPNGVPLDTPEVNAAKINHFHDVAEAKLRNGDHLIHHVAPVAVATQVVAAPVHHHLPVMGPNGVPLDTPAVVSAKMAHFAAHAKVRSGHWMGVY